MKISGARNRPRMMISGARNLQSHNEVFWAHKSSFLDDFWGQKSSHIEDFWAQNIISHNHHHYVIYHREITQMHQLPCMLELTGVITWLSWELQ